VTIIEAAAVGFYLATIARQRAQKTLFDSDALREHEETVRRWQDDRINVPCPKTPEYERLRGLLKNAEQEEASARLALLELGRKALEGI
jgi:hypothetical protein